MKYKYYLNAELIAVSQNKPFKNARNFEHIVEVVVGYDNLTE